MATTPGPWEVKQGSDERDFIVAEPSGNTVCEPNAACFDFAELDPNVHVITLAEAQANARLIAAAPELLAALKALTVKTAQGQVCFRTGNGIPMGMSKRQERLAKSAIRKAEGQ